MSKVDAISFARSLDKNEKWYMVKVFENPKARHIAEREKWVVVPYPHRGESVDNGHAMFVGRDDLSEVRIL